MDEPTIAVKTETLNRVRGMLMHLWSLLEDEETKTAINDTILELDVSEEVSDVE